MAYGGANFSVRYVPRSVTAGYNSTKTFPRFAVRGNSSHTLGSTETKVPFSQITYDSGSLWSTANERFTAPVRGIYNFNWLITCLLNDSSLYNAVYVKINGTGTTFRSRVHPQEYGTDSWNSYGGSATIDMSEGDYFELWGYTQAGTITLQSGEQNLWGSLLSYKT